MNQVLPWRADENKMTCEHLVGCGALIFFAASRSGEDVATTRRVSTTRASETMTRATRRRELKKRGGLVGAREAAERAITGRRTRTMLDDRLSSGSGKEHTTVEKDGDWRMSWQRNGTGRAGPCTLASKNKEDTFNRGCLAVNGWSDMRLRGGATGALLRNGCKGETGTRGQNDESCKHEPQIAHHDWLKDAKWVCSG